MSKRVLLVVLATVIVIGAAVVLHTRKQPREPGRCYTSCREASFSIHLPQGWRQQGEGTSVVHFFPTASQTAAPQTIVNVIIVDLHREVALDQYLQTSFPFIMRVFPDYREQARVHLRIANTDAWRVTASCTMCNVRSTMVNYILMSGHLVCMISCMASADSFPRYRQAFEWMAQSFRWE